MVRFVSKHLKLVTMYGNKRKSTKLYEKFFKLVTQHFYYRASFILQSSELLNFCTHVPNMFAEFASCASMNLFTGYNIYFAIQSPHSPAHQPNSNSRKKKIEVGGIMFTSYIFHLNASEGE